MALAWTGEDGGVWRDVRVALGRSPRPRSARAQTEAVLEGAAPDARPADHAAAVLGPRDPADRRRPLDRRLPARRRARVLHRLLREAGGW